jgi:hypothetical protein
LLQEVLSLSRTEARHGGTSIILALKRQKRQDCYMYGTISKSKTNKRNTKIRTEIGDRPI